MSTDVFRRQIPVWLASILIILMTFEYYLEIELFSNLAKEIRTWGILLASFALILGAGGMILSHARNLMQISTRPRLRERWYSSVLIVTMIIFIAIGLYMNPSSSTYQWLYTNIFSPMSMVVWGLPVFWLTSAAYRSFRARNIEAAILLVVGITTLLGFAPIGEAMFGGIQGASNWIIEVPTIGASRGIVIGAGIGTFSLAYRTLLGREKTHLGITREES
jgi:hypothetical protein